LLFIIKGASVKKNKYYILIDILIIFIVAMFSIQCSALSPAITEKTSVEITTASTSETTTSGTSAKLTIDSLKNLEYKVEYTQSGVAKLTNGDYQEEAAPGSATKIIIKLSEYVSFGDLNNDKVEDAAAILISEPGGSGTFYDLAAILNKEGNLESTNSIFLGDRIKIKTISIDSGVITVNYLDRKEEQSMAEEPTVDKTQKFIVENNILSLDNKVSVTPGTTASTETGATPTQEQQQIIYTNTQYGFNFSLPISWQGYSIVVTKWEGNPIGSNDIIEQGPIISIRNPKWTSANPYQDIPIMVFMLAQWDSLQKDKFHIGAAPIGPSELGRNTRYVFALPARYNFANPAGVEEVEKILEGNPLKAF